jgi:hypothetical protein
MKNLKNVELFQWNISELFNKCKILKDKFDKINDSNIRIILNNFE